MCVRVLQVFESTPRVLQDDEREGEIGDDDSAESGSGEYRTYTPPPMLDEAATAARVDSSPEGTLCNSSPMSSHL